MNTVLLSFPDYQIPAQRLAQQLDTPCLPVDLHHFPDGESRLRLPETLAEHVIVCRSLDHPNDKLVELLLLAQTAREMGVRQITLIAPYLCYMRQDKACQKGEAVSQLIIGRHLAGLFDNIISIDPHLHRTHNLHSAVPCKQALALTATKPMGQFLATHYKPYLLLGPDEESHQWVSAIAETAGFRFAIAKKTRYSDIQVEVELPEVDLQQADIVLVDDMISTGHTMRQTAQQLKQKGVRSINCLVTHALCDQATIEMLQTSGVEAIWSTDSIMHPTNVIQLDTLLAEAVRSLPAYANA